MYGEQPENELELMKQQLEHVKQQDRILTEIEIRLNKMKKIAEYGAGCQLSSEKRLELNKQLQEHQAAIWSLENYFL